METVRAYGDGWMMLSAGGNPETIAKVRSHPDWPQRPMTLIKGGRIVVAATRDEAIETARGEYEALQRVSPQIAPSSFEAFLDREVIGTPDECLEKLATLEAIGVNYVRVNFNSAEMQQQVAQLVLPRLAEVAATPAS
jgi:alkanesulfonate monooxygenase SsuD/methylene tetrahydromethanopterin reductase-like flavin-dependent oxidoreductase (luciferase family)